MPALRIVYAGTPEFAVPPLEMLVATGRTPLAVWTQPDRPAGRGRRLQPSPVKQFAESRGIPVHQPANLRDEQAQQALADLQPDLLVVTAYGLILPRAVLDIPAHGCWNIHASLLPRWRGAAPIQRAIEAGDRETGVCIMQMAEGLDTGPVYARAATPITEDDTAGTLHDRLAALGAQALESCIAALETGALPEPEPQDDAQATYARKLDKAEAELDFSLDAEQLARRVRAFNPWPVAWFERDGERLRVWHAVDVDGRPGAEPGTLLRESADGIDIATGDGRALRVLDLQRPGGRRMSAADHLNARRS